MNQDTGHLTQTAALNTATECSSLWFFEKYQWIATYPLYICAVSVHIHGYCDVCTLRAESVSTNIYVQHDFRNHSDPNYTYNMHIHLLECMHNGQLHTHFTYTDSHQSRAMCAYKVLLYNNLMNGIAYIRTETLEHLCTTLIKPIPIQ